MASQSGKGVFKSGRYKRCLHCDKELSMKRFKEHQRLYYDAQTKTWMTTDDNTSSENISDFSVDSDHSFEEYTRNNVEDFDEWLLSSDPEDKVDETEQDAHEQNPLFSEDQGTAFQ